MRSPALRGCSCREQAGSAAAPLQGDSLENDGEACTPMHACTLVHINNLLLGRPEREARVAGILRLVLLTTQTADWRAPACRSRQCELTRAACPCRGAVTPSAWQSVRLCSRGRQPGSPFAAHRLTRRHGPRFEARGFQRAGRAAGNPALPAARRAAVNAARNSQLFVKELAPPGGSAAAAGPGGVASGNGLVTAM